MKRTKIAGALLAGVITLTGVPEATQPLIASISAASTLPAPSGIKADVKSESVTFTWKAVKGAAAYRVSMKSRYLETYDECETVTGTSCTVKGLSSGGTHTFRITTLTKSGGKYIEQGSTKDLTIKTKVKAPSYITVSPSSAAVNITWLPTTGADAYRIFRYNSKTKKFEKYVDVKETSYSFDTLNPGESVRFKVASLVLSGKEYKVQEISPSMTALASESKGFELPDVPAFGTGAGKVLKKQGITNYTCFAGEYDTVIYIEGSIMSLLSGETNMLLFDGKDRFYAGVYMLSTANMTKDEITKVLKDKNGKGVTKNISGADVMVWDSDDVIKIAAIAAETTSSSSESFLSGLTNTGSGGLTYLEICKKYAPKELLDSFKEWNGDLSSLTPLS